MFSDTITLFARSLYFAPFTYYLSFLAACHYLHLDYIGKITFGKKHYIILTALFMYFMLSHSFEHVTSVGIASIAPFILYGVLKQNWMETIRRIFTAGISFFLCICFCMVLVLAQHTIAKKTGFQGAIDYVSMKFNKRTTGKEITDEQIANARNASQAATLRSKQRAQKIKYSDVLGKFLNDGATFIHEGNHPQYLIRYKSYLYIFIIASVLSFLISFFKKDKAEKWKTYALITTCWFALLGPLSWWIIFKAHSWHHGHLVIFLWNVPFIIFGFMVLGHAIEQIIGLGKQKLNIA